MLQIKHLGGFLLIVAFLSAGITVAAQTPGLSSSAMIERNEGEKPYIPSLISKSTPLEFCKNDLE